MKRIVIFGAGGHGREVAEVLRNQARQTTGMSVLGFVVDDPGIHSPVVNDLPVLGDWSWFQGIDRNEIAIVCAVGSPRTRARIIARATSTGLSFCDAISPHAYVSPDAKIGEGVMILPNTVVNTDTSIGDHTIINVGATVSHDTQIGQYCTINPGVHLAGNVSVGEGCLLGIGVSVIQGINIGAWTTIGAGAVVTRDLPEGVTAVGVPAKVSKTRETSYD
jgi:sugar O-acyltransferase (sialic acid O-acetyltransferase NeuD family)